MSFPDLTAAIEEIRKVASIADVVSMHVPLVKDGKNYKALCPFHKENTPSFKINIDANRFKCFGCGKSGDAIGFLMELENNDFLTVIRTLADKYGIVLPKKDPIEKVDEPVRVLYRIHEDALSYFLNCENPDVSTYIRSRDLSEESIKKFDIAVSPDNWDGLLEHLKKLNYSEKDIVASGVAVKKDDTGSVYDRFRNRMIIPIRDDQGRLVAFSGRAVTDTEYGAKYINSPSTEIFQKGGVLFALDKARSSFRQKRGAIIVEGQIDVISMHQAGFSNTVAPMGTSFTADHAKLLKKYTDRVLFIYDADPAGVNAAVRSVETCVRENMETLVVFPQPGEDPDTMIRSGGDMNELMNSGMDGFGWLLDNAADDLPAIRTPWTLRGIVSHFSELAYCFMDPLIRDLYLDMISLKTGVRNETIRLHCGHNEKKGPETGP